MFTHPYVASQLARERQRDMLAQAGRSASRASSATSPGHPGRPAGPERRTGYRTRRAAARLRAGLQA